LSTDPLAQHIEGLYVVAQSITRTTDEATRLVQQVLHSGIDQASLPPEELRPFLFRQMIALHAEQMDLHQGLQQGPPSPETLGIFSRAVPLAFLALSKPERLILTLWAREVSDSHPLHLFLDLEESEAREKLENALDRFMAALSEACLPTERSIISAYLGHADRRWLVELALENHTPPLPPSLRPSPPPLPPPPPRNRKPRNLWASGVVWALVFVSVLALVLIVARPRILERETNLVTLAGRLAHTDPLTLQTAEAESAERFILDHVGWRVAVPQLAPLTLQGVGLSAISPGVELPFLRYNSTEDEPFTVLILTYALLDQAEDVLYLEPDILGFLENEFEVDLHDLGDRQVMFWRHADDIFVGISLGQGEMVRDLVRP